MIMFKVGDVVRLKSGGPEMTVCHFSSITSGKAAVVICKWFTKRNDAWESGELQVLSDALMLVEEEKK